MSKTNIYSMVTDRIIAELQNGIIPWEKPWTGTPTGAFNRITKRAYSILNQMMLKHDSEYATYKQWQSLGGHVRKGEKSEIVVFWKILQKEDTDADGNEKIKSVPMLRYYNVFHISQVDGVEPLTKEELQEVNPIPEADDVITAYVIREGIEFTECYTDDAYYSPVRDMIHVPDKKQYNHINEYYSTVYHEMVHSTGHKNRLNRITKTAMFGNEDYSKEELVAEIGSATLMNMLGLETVKTFRNSTAYIQNWIQALQNDTRLIVNASGQADKAIDYILATG